MVKWNDGEAKVTVYNAKRNGLSSLKLLRHYVEI